MKLFICGDESNFRATKSLGFVNAVRGCYHRGAFECWHPGPDFAGGTVNDTFQKRHSKTNLSNLNRINRIFWARTISFTTCRRKTLRTVALHPGLS